MERNFANREMWQKKFNKAMDKYDKRFRGYRNMMTEDNWGYPLMAFGRPVLFKNGRKP